MMGLGFRRLKRLQLLVAVIVIMSVALSACGVGSAVPSASTRAPTSRETASLASRSLGWEEYATPVVVAASGVSQVVIDYAWDGWGERQLAWAVKKTGAGYETEQGESVDASLVATLGSSLTNLRRSGGLKSCLNHTDDYPDFRIQLFFEDGSDATLLSDSNCPQNVPWNVVYEDELYVQYTGEIPAALRALFDALVDDPKQKELIDAQPDWLGFAFSIIGGELPAGIKETGFSEVALYFDLLTGSTLFVPFAAEYEVRDLGLFCSPDVDNRDCFVIDGTVTLESRSSSVVFSVPVRFLGLEVSDIGFEAQEIQEIGERVSEHVLAQRVRDRAPGATLRITCASASRCDEGGPFSAVYASLGRAAPSECSPCSFKFDGWDAYHELVHFPDLEQIWVDRLHYGADRFQASRDVLGMDQLLSLYRSPGHETFVDEHIIDFEIQSCDRMMAFFEPGVLESNPDYVSSLDENSLNYANRIDISGYCVFVVAQGELEANKYDLREQRGSR
jgi:hypothetical protein